VRLGGGMMFVAKIGEYRVLLAACEIRNVRNDEGVPAGQKLRGRCDPLSDDCQLDPIVITFLLLFRSQCGLEQWSELAVVGFNQVASLCPRVNQAAERWCIL